MTRAKLFLGALPLLLAAALMSACQLGGGGTEVPNEITGRIYLGGGQPAADAEVILYPVNYVPGNPDSAAKLKIVRTDKTGKFSFSNVTHGEYNVLSRMVSSIGKRASGLAKAGAVQDVSYDLLAFSDSLLISGEAQELSPDTLRMPGSLIGKIQLQPQDDPRSAVVQILGTDYYTNVDSAGNFAFDNLAQGSYRLQVSTYLAGYVPLFKEILVLSGKSDTLPESLTPFYSSIPVVTGLTAQARTDGTILLRWNKTTYGQLQAYLIFRDTAGTFFPGAFLLAATTDTTFVDTVYKNTRYPFGDTSNHAYEYRIRIQSRSNAVGPLWGSDTVTVQPSAVASNRWHLALAQAPFAARSLPNALVFHDTLWVLGGQAGDSVFHDAWSSADGTHWRKVTDSLPVPSSTYPLNAVVFQNKLWVMGIHNYQNFLWNSADGIHWSSVSDTVNSGPVVSPVLLEFQNQLWMTGGVVPLLDQPLPSFTPVTAVRGADYSTDGINWTWTGYSSDDSAPVPSVGTDSSLTNAVVFNGKMWVVGGMNVNRTASLEVRNSADGHAWSAVGDTAFLPRYDHSLAVHDGKMWVIGGNVTNTMTFYSITSVETALTNDVWNSADGVTWSPVDTRAPFPARAHHAAVSFQGRLWLIGGDNEQGPLGDIWYFQ